VGLPFLASALLALVAAGCGDDNGGDAGGAVCDGVTCHAHATCEPATGACVCDEGYEGWTEGAGCTPEVLSIFGSYDDGWGGHHEIVGGVWTQGGYGAVSRFFVSQFSNSSRHLIAQNGADNEWSPGLWSRFDWTHHDAGDGEVLYFCQTTYDAATEQDALDTPAADPTDPAAGGCGGFAWSALSPGAPQLAIVGSFVDGFDGTHEIDGAVWTQGGFGNPSFFHVTQFSNEGGFAVAHNNVHNAFGGGKWSRFDWTWHDAGEGRRLHYCQTSHDAQTEEAALAVPSADASDPTASGCGDFAWSSLSGAEPQLILAGLWSDNFGTRHAVDAASWTQETPGFPEHTYGFTLSQFSNAEMWLSAQNDADNPSGGGGWSRFDWTWFDAGEGLELWYCQTAFEAASEEDALAAAQPDDTDPSAGGCGASTWSKLIPFVAPSE